MVKKLISGGRLSVDPGALFCVTALRAKAKERDTPLGMTSERDGDELGVGLYPLEHCRLNKGYAWKPSFFV